MNSNTCRLSLTATEIFDKAVSFCRERELRFVDNIILFNVAVKACLEKMLLGDREGLGRLTQICEKTLAQTVLNPSSVGDSQTRQVENTSSLKLVLLQANRIAIARGSGTTDYTDILLALIASDDKICGILSEANIETQLLIRFSVPTAE